MRGTRFFFLYLRQTEEMNRARIYKSIGDDNAQSTDKTLSCKQKRKPPSHPRAASSRMVGAVCRLARGHVLRICFFLVCVRRVFGGARLRRRLSFFAVVVTLLPPLCVE